MDLTDEQADVADHSGSLYAKACPGSGKTRALVARAQQLAENLPPASGLALLSFTNSAADEFKERLVNAGASSLLNPPHFVGTIDSFLGRYVVAPRGNPFAPNQPITYVDSWHQYDVRVLTGTITAKGKRDQRVVKLSAFPVTEVDLPGRTVRTQLDFDLLARQHGRGLADQLQGLPLPLRQQAESTAAKTLGTLMAGGRLTPTEVRLLATELLSPTDLEANAHLRNLVSRFPHVVVDESQDCDSVVLGVFRRLLDMGSELTLIGDPDQCIYRWRGADPEGLQALSKGWRPGPRLTGNFRSSPNICRAASTLKREATVDHSCGPPAQCPWPVYVVPLTHGKPLLAGRLFLDLLVKHALKVENAIVLAPTWSLAMAIAGAKPPQGKRQRLGGRLRDACHIARMRPSGRSISRVRALIEEHLRKRLPEGVIETRDPSQRQWLESEVRRLAHEVLVPEPTSEHWHRRTFDILKTFRTPAGVIPVALERTHLPKPGKPLQIEGGPSDGLAFSSVHQAKGREYDAVLFAAGRRVDEKLTEFMSGWKAREAGSESRAVAYVAVTRAMRLLAVSAPRKKCDEVQQLLQRDGAAVELLDPAESPDGLDEEERNPGQGPVQ